MTRPLLADAFDHHVWATLQVIDACLPLSADQLASTVPGTYGSILDTMRHLVGADAGYLFALTGGRLQMIEEDRMDLAALRSVMVGHGADWAAVIDESHDPDVTVTRRRDDGSESRAPLGIRLAQALDHGTDHRSQICTGLTALGVTPPEIDAWAFADEAGRLSETPPEG
jgi:uncharacterized damage-inducible protein DinB